MLNDLALPTRLLIGAMGLVLGVMVAGPLFSTDPLVGLLLVCVGSVIEVVIMIGWSCVVSVAERRLRDRVAAASGEIASGAVTPTPAAARVVRRRLDRRHSSFLPQAGGSAGPSAVLVLTALDAAGPRRVAAFVPAGLSLSMRRAPVAVLLHPTQPDVAVVDDRVGPADLAAIAHDPRWTTDRLPSDRTVVGGYSALLLSVLLGAGVGLGLVGGVLAVV